MSNAVRLVGDGQAGAPDADEARQRLESKLRQLCTSTGFMSARLFARMGGLWALALRVGPSQRWHGLIAPGAVPWITEENDPVPILAQRLGCRHADVLAIGESYYVVLDTPGEASAEITLLDIERVVQCRRDVMTIVSDIARRGLAPASAATVRSELVRRLADCVDVSGAVEVLREVIRADEITPDPPDIDAVWDGVEWLVEWPAAGNAGLVRLRWRTDPCLDISVLRVAIDMVGLWDEVRGAAVGWRRPNESGEQ